MAEENNNAANADEGNREYTRTHENREFHNISERDQSITPEDLDGPVENENFDAFRAEGDLYPNTITGSRVSASDRKENFTDENYGATGQKTRKDIIRDTETEE